MSSVEQRWKFAHNMLDMAATALDKGVVPLLHSNETINRVSSAMLSPFAVAGKMKNNRGFINSLEDVYTRKAFNKEGKVVLDGLNYANIAGSAFTAGIGAGILGGLTHDSAGNPDIAGIPMI